MPLIALISLGMAFAGVMYLNDARPEYRKYAKIGVIAGAIGTTIAGMATMGPMAALLIFAVFVALSLYYQIWK
ncbi:MAG: hypothetical protein AAFN80_10555 [Pseudomonadota bacterium]